MSFKRRFRGVRRRSTRRLTTLSKTFVYERMHGFPFVVKFDTMATTTVAATK